MTTLPLTFASLNFLRRQKDGMIRCNSFRFLNAEAMILSNGVFFNATRNATILDE